MRLPLLTLCLAAALAQPAFAHGTQDDHDEHEHGSLGAHVHGESHLDMAQTDTGLELQWRSPAADLVGFEHAPRSQAEKDAVAALRQALENPQALVKLPAAAECKLAEATAVSPLFAADTKTSGHLDVEASMSFSCSKPAALDSLDLTGWFAHFPNSHSVEVQAIVASGQQGAELTAKQPQLKW
ncbi:ZrgA family zinc uptake protein [Pseudomonas sp. EpS/L25]|uniref:ZrgA family zinc uptake protein n=1 Tax=Pseudomonas sp. EpS/L25 TaxID=1749078 RepID=UPI0007444A56|nr:DUF2796 domain-containing protein [Pseudomonas sp. EpS/L25]KUM37925.1 hypothetical protein AR540_14230 [Pseudomonas sp. EpS/L25]